MESFSSSLSSPEDMDCVLSILAVDRARKGFASGLRVDDGVTGVICCSRCSSSYSLFSSETKEINSLFGSISLWSSSGTLVDMI